MTDMASAHRGERAEPELDPVLDFMRLLWGIEHKLQSASKRMESTIGITGPQRLVLRVVARFPGLSAGELAHIVRLHPSTVTGILQRLVQKKLLAREVDPADSRRVRLTVRPRGEAFTHRSRGTVEAAVARALAHVPAVEVRRARHVLTTVIDTLGAEW
jgi:DNA-binding MarR family transcriptional regulator